MHVIRMDPREEWNGSPGNHDLALPSQLTSTGWALRLLSARVLTKVPWQLGLLVRPKTPCACRQGQGLKCAGLRKIFAAWLHKHWPQGAKSALLGTSKLIPLTAQCRSPEATHPLLA